MWIQRRHHFFLFILGAIALSMIPVLHWPFSWLETYFHEMSHGLAALLTGGKIERIELNFDGSGVCYTRGGWAPLVSFAGYSGASLWGGLIYLSARMTGRASRWLSLLMVVAMSLSAVFWVRDAGTFVVLSILCITLYISFHYLIGSVFPYFMEFAGIYVMVGAARSPTYLLDNQNVGDGAALAALTFVPEIVWVLVWCGIAAAALFWVWKRQPLV